MKKLKEWAGGRYAVLLRNTPIELLSEHYQRRFDGDRLGTALSTLRLAAAKGNKDSEDEIYACYPMRKQLDQRGFEDLLQEYDVISFDVFDTLLFRRVDKPADVFSLVEKEVSMPGFARDRVVSEHLARERKFAAEGTYEVTIDDIYRMPTMKAYAVREDLIGLELAAERHSCYANPSILDVFNRLCAAGKTVVATSDMYLHADFIRELLGICGYHGLDTCFVSGDYGAGKGSGELFNAVRKCAAGRRTVHIGDNFFGDVYPLKGQDIMPVHYLTDKRKRKGESI